jgi:hypothetical protein
MSIPLVPCPGCKRHILSSESACPFCQSPVPTGFGPAPRRAAGPVTGPLVRAAIVFMGAATSACSSSSAPDTTPAVDASMGGDSEPLPVVFYGPAILDDSGTTLEKDAGDTDAAPTADASSDAGAADASDGAPADAATDAGAADAGPDAS